MRTDKTRFVLLSLVALTALFASAWAGADYEISWYTIDGGGGTSRGGQYELTGTIGQPDADWSEGGDYELLGGFWPGGPLCFVDFAEFARFADYWLLGDMTGDLNSDAVVNFEDVQWFADFWLDWCPYRWPLR